MGKEEKKKIGGEKNGGHRMVRKSRMVTHSLKQQTENTEIKCVKMVVAALEMITT